MGLRVDRPGAAVKLVHVAAPEEGVVHAHVGDGAALVLSAEGSTVHRVLWGGLAERACAVGGGDRPDGHCDLVERRIGCARHGLFYGGAILP